MSNDILNISFVGSGNVATNMAKELFSKGLKINQVFSRNLENAKHLASEVDAKGINNFNILSECDLVIISVPDDAVESCLKNIPQNIPVVHTSGNTSLQERENGLSGVFYPLQTFSKDTLADWSNIPICIESENEQFLKTLYQLGEKISSTVKIITSENRKLIHLAAVFACNFSNHMGAISEKFMNENGMEMELLNPLMSQTFENTLKGNISEKQTGPAKREDFGTITSHLELLQSEKTTKELYLSISKHIMEFHDNTEL